MNTIRVGLISDTHNLLRTEAKLALKGVDHVIHAGDICGGEVLRELEAIAPVTAVRGNNDYGGWADALHVKERIEIGGVPIYIVHDLQDLDIVAEDEGIKVVVTGHSHRPLMKMENGVLYINPGSAGPRRFTLPISIGFLEIADGRAKGRLQTLEVN